MDNVTQHLLCQYDNRKDNIWKLKQYRELKQYQEL